MRRRGASDLFGIGDLLDVPDDGVLFRVPSPARAGAGRAMERHSFGSSNKGPAVADRAEGQLEFRPLEALHACNGATARLVGGAAALAAVRRQARAGPGSSDQCSNACTSRRFRTAIVHSYRFSTPALTAVFEPQTTPPA